MKGENRGDQSHNQQHRGQEQGRGHQTSINAIMGPGPEMERSTERTPLLGNHHTQDHHSRNNGSLSGMEKGQRRASSARGSAGGGLGFLAQVWLLMWKNWLLKRRSLKVTLTEIFIPLAGAAIMVAIRQIVVITDVPTPTTWGPQSLGPSAAGTLDKAGQHMLYAPNTTLVSSIMGRVNTTLTQELDAKVTIMGFASEEEVLKFHELNSANSTHNYSITLIFDIDPAATTLPPNVKYTIRPASEAKDKWNTQRVFSFDQVLSPRDASQNYYYNRSFVYTQRVVSEALIQTWRPGAALNVSEWRVRRMPYPPYINDVIVQVVQQNFSRLLMLSFILSVIILCKNIVYEKERQLKESMKLMGMSAAAHWTSWFLLLMVYLAVASGIYTLLMCLQMGSKPPVLVYSDPSLVFVFLLLYSFSIICFTFLVSTFVSKANVGAAIGGILFFATYLPNTFLEERYQDMALSSKLGFCVLFNMAMSFGVKTIGLYEGTGKGAQWGGFTEAASVDDNFTLLHAMLMLGADSLLLLLCTWYIDNVRPGTYGVPRPWYFPFQASYWCGGEQITVQAQRKGRYGDGSRHFEPDPTGLPVGISMVHLRKAYSPSLVAVEDSTLNMYEGQITVLLGHNGAGKTTTMSMLTGFIPPTSGTAYVNGYDICKDINKVRNNLGLCPQHNILFDTLTVDEHLYFFARLKGCPKKEIPQAVEDMAVEVGLGTKRSARAGTLSGGQKRKLSVGIALIGGSKIVILDEPTSGMDPAARRQTWDILQRQRKGRTLLLSTHFMDEADLLGDRIAIMAEGVIKCCGTSLFLKKLYGAGYHMVLVKGPRCDVARLTEVVKEQVRGAQLESQVGAELSYLLPEEEVAQFASLFQVMEERRGQLGVTSFGATATTMEEVFLKVGAHGASESVSRAGVDAISVNTLVTPDSLSSSNASHVSSHVSSHASSHAASEATVEGFSNTGPSLLPKSEDVSQWTEGSEVDSLASSKGSALTAPIGTATPGRIAELALDSSYQRLRGFSLHLSRFRGMFVKKALHTLRNRIISAVQLALPVIFTITALLVDKVRPHSTDQIPLALDLAMFGETLSAYTAGVFPSPQSQAVADVYLAQFSGSNKIEAMNRTAFPDLDNFYLHQASRDGLYTYNKKVVIGGQFEPQALAPDMLATAWYSGQPYHAMPVSVAYMMNAFARQVAGEDHSIAAVNHPMPKSEAAGARDSLTQALALGFSIGFSMLFGMAFLTASFSYFLIRERQTGAKHLQVVSGVGPLAFWLAALAWDLVNYLLPCLVLLVVFAAFQVEAYTEGGNLGLVLMFLLMFGMAVIPFIYVLQFPFSTPATGFVSLIIIATISGLFTMMTVFIMRLPTLGVEEEAKVLDWVFMAVFPYYNLGMGFSNIYVNKMDQDFCLSSNFDLAELCPFAKLIKQPNPCCKDYCGDICLPFEDNFLAWEYPGIGRNTMFLGLQCIVFFLMALLIDLQVVQKLVYLCRCSSAEPHPLPTGADDPKDQDSDVVLEQQRVAAGAAGDDTLVLQQLYKQYGAYVAVDYLSVGVPENECFGLLGQNGAGKTTTFKMLTGSLMVSGGDATVRQHSIKSDIKQVQANMGYCPQFDALIDQMTGRETLTMYARLRGVPAAHIRRIVDNLIDLLMLRPHANKMTMDYSGGNKRKLSTAIALVGGPAVILLDEPSSGMDPAARRQLWNVLSQVRASGRTLILTSHSMEECDALCTRIAIMVNGQFRCLGSPQHLKSKFGHGYTLVVKMATRPDGTTASPDPLVTTILNKFPGTHKFDDHQGYVHFQVPDARVPLSRVFHTMEGARSTLGVEDYSVHQTTLEQVFLTFTKQQNPPRQTRSSLRCCCLCPCLS